MTARTREQAETELMLNPLFQTMRVEAMIEAIASALDYLTPRGLESNSGGDLFRSVMKGVDAKLFDRIIAAQGWEIVDGPP